MQVEEQTNIKSSTLVLKKSTFFFLFFSSVPLLPSYGYRGFFYSFNLFTDGRTPWTSDLPVARPLPKHRTTQTQKNVYTHQISMPWVGFENTIPASERAKTVHALDRSATVTGKLFLYVI
jgi:hypothetical protein